MKIVFLKVVRLVVFSTILISCERHSNLNDNKKDGIGSAKASEVRRSSHNASASGCSDHMRDFLRWYLDFFEKDRLNLSLINIPKFDNSNSITPRNSDNVSKGKYYELNKRNMNRYLEKLSKSGYFSEFYISSARRSILTRGKVLEAAKQEDGPAEGFEFDEVFQTQEMYTLADINRLRVNSANKNVFILPVSDDFKWVLYTKENYGKCLIDSISSQ